MARPNDAEMAPVKGQNPSDAEALSNGGDKGIDEVHAALGVSLQKFCRPIIVTQVGLQ